MFSRPLSGPDFFLYPQQVNHDRIEIPLKEEASLLLNFLP